MYFLYLDLNDRDTDKKRIEKRKWNISGKKNAFT